MCFLKNALQFFDSIIIKSITTTIIASAPLSRCHRLLLLLTRSQTLVLFYGVPITWVEFPNLRQTDYAPLLGRSGPNFNPTGMLIVSASSGEAESAITGITVEKSQRDPNDKPWWWIRGDTYTHRDLLKRWGCRWSKRQKAWYVIGWQLPNAVQSLIDAQNTPIVQENQPSMPENMISDDEFDPCSVEEAAAILGMAVKDKQAVYQPESVAIESSDDAIVDQVSDEAEETPKVRIIKPMLDIPEGEEPDAVITAIRQTKSSELSVVRQATGEPSGKRTLTRIPQAPCGELTDSITGNVWCYGWAIHEGKPSLL